MSIKIIWKGMITIKRVGYLFEKIADLNNILNAHLHARQDKRFYYDVKRIDKNPEKYCQQISEILLNGTYEVSEYTEEIINERGKERLLQKLPYFPDRIIQWAIMLQIEPYLTRQFVYHTCSSIPGRGQRRAIDLMASYLRDEKGTVYCLKIDIRHFYPSIDRTILKEKLRTIFKDPKLLQLLDLIIDSPPGDTGVPIGSYISQYLANFYLSKLDHQLKEVYHLPYVVRYADDIVILHRSKARLHFILNDLKFILDKYYHLEIKSNYQIFEVESRGVDFCGYVFYHNKILLRKSTKLSMIEKLTKIKEDWDNGIPLDIHSFGTINSYNGILLFADTYNLYKKYFVDLLPAIRQYRQSHGIKHLEDMRQEDRFNRVFHKGIYDIDLHEYKESTRLIQMIQQFTSPDYEYNIEFQEELIKELKACRKKPKEQKTGSQKKK